MRSISAAVGLLAMLFVHIVGAAPCSPAAAGVLSVGWQDPASPAAARAALLYPASDEPSVGLRQRSRPSALDDDEHGRAVDPWFSFDKAQHLTFSFLFSVGWQYGLENKLDWERRDALTASLASTLLIGLGKELYDWRLGPRRFFSYRDMVANGAGLLLATGFIIL